MGERTKHGYQRPWPRGEGDRMEPVRKGPKVPLDQEALDEEPDDESEEGYPDGVWLPAWE
jgi:hypothetical protein